MSRWHIVGAGAIGGLWAHKLAAAGHDVCLVLKDEAQRQAYHQAGGIRLKQAQPTPQPEHLLRFDACTLADISPHASPTGSATSSTPITHVLLCCKSWQTQAVVTRLAPHLQAHSTVVLLQNGLRQLYQCQTQLSHCALYCATTTDGAFKHGSFGVTLAGVGETLIGGFNPLATQTNPLASAQLNTQWRDNIEALLWQKLCVNAVINPLTARYDIANGEVFSDARTHAILEPLCEEISRIVNAQGHAMSAEQVWQHSHAVAQKTAHNSSSMREDKRANRRTEIDEMNGYLLALAAQHNISAPVNQALVAALINK